jgi:hypothetical protein
MQNDQLFLTLSAMFIPFVVAILLALAEKAGFVWAKVNQPTIAAIVGAFIGALYHVDSIYVALNAKPPADTLGAFIMGGIMAGLAGSGIKSWVKDAKTGTLTAFTEADVLEMRRKNDSGDGIGA